MRGFLLHSLDCSEIVQTVEVSHPSSLVPAGEGYRWSEVPVPASEWTIALVEGEVSVVPFVPAMDRQIARKRADLLQQVKARRDATEWAGCTTPYGVIDTDPDSQRKIGGGSTAALALGGSFSTDWRMADNTVATFDAAAMIEAGLLVVAHINACQRRKNELDALIAAAETLADLEAIDIEAGWPA